MALVLGAEFAPGSCPVVEDNVLSRVTQNRRRV